MIFSGTGYLMITLFAYYNECGNRYFVKEKTRSASTPYTCTKILIYLLSLSIVYAYVLPLYLSNLNEPMTQNLRVFEITRSVQYDNIDEVTH